MLGPVVIDLGGTELSQEEVELITHPHVGGLIFFSRNFEEPEQLAELVKSIRAVRPELILSVDQEGGRVQRFRSGFTLLPPLQKLGKHLQEGAPTAGASITSCAWIMAAELLSVGVDISFAPVLDADDDFSQVIGDRSFSRDTQQLTAAAAFYLDGMSEAGMVATAKHFPGHGAVRADSHVALPVDQREFDEVWEADMYPFRMLLQRMGAVMPAHILFNSIDQSPVGCSRFWLQQVLRQKLGFNGVIFSDDLSMAGAQFAGSYSDRAVAALEAGCDAVLVCNQPQEAAGVLEHLSAVGWPIDDKLAHMRPRLAEAYQSLSQLRNSPRWQSAKQQVEALGAAG